MTLDVSTVTAFGVGGVIFIVFLSSKLREWALFFGSVSAVYWLQSPLPIRFLDFELPTLTLLVTVTVWLFVRDNTRRQFSTQDRLALGGILLIILVMAAMRYVQPVYRLTPSRPPQMELVITGLIIWGFVAGGLWLILSKRSLALALHGLLLVIIGLFFVFKTESIAVELSRLLRSQTGQDTTIAKMSELSWLGFSYIAFRLIHTIRDKQAGRLPALELHEFITYVVFFPSLIAGPIDRAERFSKDFRTLSTIHAIDPHRFMVGAGRITVGIFKKFVIADTLAQGIALNVANASETTSTLFLWVLLYGYALRLFFDFSGYSDIAIGIGMLFGITLPENFNRPYLKTNLTTFWQNWHMTLSNWARFYIFTPLSRTLLTRKPRPSNTLIVLVTQVSTMIIIGLWHGISWNFLIWGLWHGFGLFVHKLWSDRTRVWHLGIRNDKTQLRLWSVVGWFITFHFVVVGWVWFALPSVDLSLSVLMRLVGV